MFYFGIFASYLTICKNMKTLFSVILLSVTILSCTNNKTATITALEKADSLFNTENDNDAYKTFIKISRNDIKSDEERALYTLLENELYKETEISGNTLTSNFSAMDFVIDYYTKKQDLEHLARACYCKSLYLYEKGDIKNSLLNMKKAENYEKKSNLLWLRNLIYLNLSFINQTVGANNTGLEYARKALKSFEKEKHQEGICRAYNNMAICFYNMKQKDSAEYYMAKNKQYLKYVSSGTDSAVFITNIGMIYYESGEYRKAEQMFIVAENLLSMPQTQTNLAKVYGMLGKDSESDSLFRMAWAKADYETKAEILQFKAERADSKGDFEVSTKLLKDVQAMKDSMALQNSPEEAVRTQHEYEHEQYKRETADREIYAALAIAAAVAVMAALGTGYHRKRINKARSTISNSRQKIEEYTERIGALEKSDKQNSIEIEKLTRKIKNLKEEQTKILSRGKTLYEKIKSGETAATWRKQEFEEFAEYYRIGNPQTMDRIENGYSRLSAVNTFYIILADIGYDDTGAAHIMNMSHGAMRTMKSRINAKKKA